MTECVCPCCRATNTTGPNCRRCKADLSLLLCLESDREAWLAYAKSELTGGRTASALEALAAAELLRPGRDLNQLRAVAHLLMLDFFSALGWHQRATSM